MGNDASKSGKTVRKRLARSYITSVVSISLVLFLVAVVLFFWVNIKSISNYFKENSVVSVILTPEADEKDALELRNDILQCPFVRDAVYISKEQGQKEMEEMLGKGFLDVFESSPIPISLEVNLVGEYFATDSLKMVKEQFSAMPKVREVTYQESLVEALNSNLDKIGLIAAAVIALLLFISVVLIGNTVRLNVYSKRFTIHTMRLVGAKRSFIRRPFSRQAFWQGAVSALLAVGCSAALLYYAWTRIGDIFGVFSLKVIIPIFAVVFVFGILICVITSMFMVNKLADISKDDLYL